MRGDRQNYGKRSDARNVTLRLYGETRVFVEAAAARNGVSVQDVILELIRKASPSRETA